MGKIEVVLSLTILLLFSCSRGDADSIDRAVRIVEENLDSALTIMKQLNVHSLSARDKARYGVIFTMAQDKSGQDVRDDSLIRISYDYYRHHTDEPLYAKCQYYMGKYYMLVDSMATSSRCLESAIASARCSGDAYTEYLSLEKLSYVLCGSHPAEAVKCARRAFEIYDSMPSHNLHNRVTLLSNLGVCNGWGGNEKASSEAHSKAIAHALALSDSVLISKTYYAAAHSFLLFEKADSALWYAEKAYAYDSSAMLMYAMCLVEAGRLKDAFPLFEKDFNSRNPIDKYVSGKYLCELTLQLHHLDDACAYFDSSCVLYEEECQKAYVQQGKYYEDAMSRLKEMERMKSATTLRNAIFIFIICFLLLVTSFVIFAFLWRRKVSRRQLLVEKRHRRLQLEIENERHERRLRLKEVQMEMMKKHLQEKLVFFQRLNSIQKNGFSDKIVISDAEWKEIEVFLEGVDNMFVSRFKQKFPNLTEDDIRFVMLIRLGFKTRDFANYYCINERSVKQKCFKFKSKIELDDPNISLKKYISGF